MYRSHMTCSRRSISPCWGVRPWKSSLLEWNAVTSRLPIGVGSPISEILHVKATLRSPQLNSTLTGRSTVTDPSVRSYAPRLDLLLTTG
jgi:hypothetical protein